MRYNDTKWWGVLGEGRFWVVIMLVWWSWRIHCSSITLHSSASLINKHIPASYIRNCQPKLTQWVQGCRVTGALRSLVFLAEDKFLSKTWWRSRNGQIDGATTGVAPVIVHVYPSPRGARGKTVKPTIMTTTGSSLPSKHVLTYDNDHNGELALVG